MYAIERGEACAAVGEDGRRKEIGWAPRHRSRPRATSVATVSRIWWDSRRAPDPITIHIHEPVRLYLQSSSSSSCSCSTSSSRSLSQSLNLLHASHHLDQLVDHQFELFTAPLHPTDLVTHLCEHVVHLGLRVVHFPVFDAHVYLPFFEVDPSRDLTVADALAECEDAVDVTLQRRHVVALRRDFARHQDRRECLRAACL